MSNDRTIERLSEKLSSLRKRDKKLAIFGAGSPFGHGYQTHPVSLRQVTQKEAEFGFSLPEEYRDWLVNVGWGAGPDYGLFAPDKVHSQLFLDEEHGSGGDVENAAEITPTHIAAIQGKWESSGVNSALGISVNTDRNFLVISEVGCGGYTGIVLKGPMQGKVFGLSSEIVEPRSALFALIPEGSLTWLRKERGRGDLAVNATATFGFFSWYEDWLDRGIASL